MFYEQGMGANLIFAEQGQMQQNLDGLGVGSEDDEFADPTIQSLCGLVGAFTKLLVMARLWGCDVLVVSVRWHLSKS